MVRRRQLNLEWFKGEIKDKRHQLSPLCKEFSSLHKFEMLHFTALFLYCNEVF